MKFRFAVSALLTVTSSALFLVSAPQVKAQGSGQPQVSVVNLQAIKNSNGGTSVVTPKGDLAPLPGAGVNGNVAQIYIGANGGFWYTDKSGRTVDLHDAVQQLQAKRAQLKQANQVPQYAPVADSQQQQQQQTTSSGGSSALGTAAAAGLGAMAGSAMTNARYNMPYGTPMYYGRGGTPYYYNNGERRELNSNQKAVLYNQNQQKQQQKQQVYQNRQNQQQQKQQTIQQGQANRQSRFDQRQASAQNRQQAGGQSRFGGNRRANNNYQKQQQWYQKQLSQNKDRASKWKQQSGSNPFVNQSHSGNRLSRGGDISRGGRFSQAGNSSRGSRFQGRQSRQRPTRSRGGRHGRFGR